ncbi:hypothetical protein [Desertivirga brevis]|uniref:hypothetical protein n=1 Tax=Desertivirga brevis TaxID=2810310 RepID=UPI001A95E8A4|nr:hypothetical protein [Pedobacter sp. SYSU D00873]
MNRLVTMKKGLTALVKVVFLIGVLFEPAILDIKENNEKLSWTESTIKFLSVMLKELFASVISNISICTSTDSGIFMPNSQVNQRNPVARTR